MLLHRSLLDLLSFCSLIVIVCAVHIAYHSNDVGRLIANKWYQIVVVALYSILIAGPRT